MHFCYYYFILFKIYLFILEGAGEKEGDSTCMGGEGQRERIPSSSPMSVLPDVRLDSMALRPRPDGNQQSDT